jgi:hypothetical protein
MPHSPTSPQPTHSFPFRIDYLIVALVVIWFGVSAAWHPTLGGFLHGVNFLFHEAGHFFFRPFGQFIGTLGGTLGEMTFPIVCTIYFAYKKQRFSAFVTLMWLAHVLFGVSVYAGDAAATRLPLPENTYHDWNWMFRRLGILKYTTGISRLIYTAGLATLVGSTIGMLLHARHDPDDPFEPPQGEERKPVDNKYKHFAARF